VSQNETIGFEILRAIRRILRRTSEHSRSIGRHSGVSVPQMLCLKAIADLPQATDATVAKVAEMVQLSPPTVSRILDRLERDGYLIRERSPYDRRKVCLTLTEFGRRKLENLPMPLQQQFLERLQELDEAEVRQLLASLECIVQLMGAGDIDASPMLTPQVEVDRYGSGEASSYPE